MRGHTHLLFAVLLAIFYFDYFNVQVGIWLKVAFATALIIGALLPDIDEAESSAARRAPLMSALIRIFSRHRGIMHSIWIPLILFLILKFLMWRFVEIPNLVFIGFLIGYGSHLIADSLTTQGIEPLNPISRFRLRGWLRTGGLAEAAIGILIVAFILVH